jgi:3-phenylpropionate/trans-cinnamate dioxygenase ferredoxin subunit
MTRYHVAATNEIPPGYAKVVNVGDLSLAVCNVAGEFFVIDDHCTHDNGPLGEGRLVGDQIECPRHGARFNVRTGRVTRMPAVRPVKTYPISVENGAISIDIEDAW